MTIVRESNLAGPCIELGELIRETAQFYVFRDNFPPPNEHRIAKRKRRVHLEPCTRCEDHPQTQYPNGYTG
jgi:hypothetical protein